jgi:hypothetical protein
MWHVCGRKEIHPRFWWGNLKEGHQLEDLGIHGRILTFMLKEQGSRA